MKTKITLFTFGLAAMMAHVSVSATLVFQDSFIGTAGQSLNDYNSNYSISTHIRASNSDDYTTTTFADSRYLYATADFYVESASDLTNGNLGITTHHNWHASWSELACLVGSSF
ncbi:MAG: hypothetical protein JJU29_16925 [Verrucomicrobia bacterium]|nr:hypothetical protein [Verrucomicrobiota bacterium]MCH8514582.1 hypothetical protein [Kiritimatiellia bacterium]